MDVRSPYDQQLVGTIALEDAASVEQKIRIALELRKKFPAGLPADQRINLLNRLATLMESKAEELTLLATREGGKPYVDSAVEIARAIHGVKLAAEYTTQIKGREIPMGLNAASKNKKAFTIKEPIGLVVAISAFNHPLNLLVHQVVTAFAAGCPVIVKPDLRTPLSCLRLLELMAEAGIPNGWCQYVLCENQLAEKLATDSRVNFMSFIGSAKIGWYLRSKLAPGTRCGLEHGGIAPAILLEDADLKIAVPSLTKGAFYHAGQVCVSTQRIFIPTSLSDTFCNELKKAAEKLVVGDPLDKTTAVGPIISAKELQRIDQWVREAISAGAQLITGGKQLSASCYTPTILLNPPREALVSTQEIFGPVVCVYTYTDVNDAIDQANNTVYHFQASVFSADTNRAQEIAKKLNASAVMINEHTAFRVDWMPFAGRDQSGLGIGGIQYSMDDLLVEKMIVFNIP